MKNKVITATILLLSVIGTFTSCRSADQLLVPQQGKIFVNGVELSQEYALIYYDADKMENCNTELPFTAILQCYGFEIEWMNDFHAKLTFNERSFELDLERITVIEEGAKESILLPAPGGRRTYTVAHKELYLDSSTTRSFMSLIDEDLMSRTDYENFTVSVTFDREASKVQRKTTL